MEDCKPLIAVERVALVTFQVEDSAGGVDVEPAGVPLLILLQFLRRDWCILVIVVADTLYISHIDHLLSFLGILRIVTIVEEKSLIFEPNIAFLPVRHPEVSGAGFL